MALISTATYLAAASFAVGAVGTYQSYSSQKSGQKQSAQASTLRARADAVAQQRERAKTIRESRIKAAAINAATNAGGATGSSVQAGSIGDIQSQGAAGVNFLDTTGSLITASNSALTKANDYYGSSNTFSGIASLGFQFASYAGNDFSTKKKKSTDVGIKY